MQDIPRLHIELEGVRSKIVTLLSDHNNMLGKMVTKTLEETITEEWVQQKINVAVRQCIEKAIKSVSDNYTLQIAIKELVSEQIARLVEHKPAKPIGKE